MKGIVLVTGGTGFLGEYVVKEFINNGYEVIAIGRNESKGRELEKIGANFVKVDFCNYESIEPIVSTADYVVHCGALSTIWGAWDEFFGANILGLKNVMEASLKFKVKRFIFVSSPSIYSCKEDRLIINENDYNKNNELNYYIKSKIIGEEEIMNFNRRGLYTVVIRPRGLFGVGDNSIVPRLLEANKKIGVPLFKEGKNLVDMTYVENVALALRLCCEKNNINGEIFNITNGEPMEFKKILDKVFCEIDETISYRMANFKVFYSLAIFLEFIYKVFKIKKEPVITKYIVCTLATSQTLDINNAKEKLGYSPKVSIDEGIKIYGKWYREHNRRG